MSGECCDAAAPAICRVTAWRRRQCATPDLSHVVASGVGNMRKQENYSSINTLHLKQKSQKITLYGGKPRQKYLVCIWSLTWLLYYYENIILRWTLKCCLSFFFLSAGQIASALHLLSFYLTVRVYFYWLVITAAPCQLWQLRQYWNYCRTVDTVKTTAISMTFNVQI